MSLKRYQFRLRNQDCKTIHYYQEDIRALDIQ